MNNLMANLLSLQNLELTPGSKDDAKIADLRKKIPVQILGHYDRLLARGKKGVALVRNGVCRECHMQVAVGVVAALHHGDDIHLCGSCGRYLMLEPEAPAPPAPPLKAPKRKVKPKVLHVI